MTLSPEIMKTDPTGDVWDSAAMSHDITHMDPEQLNRYVRMTFLDEYDLSFLPNSFWGRHYDANYFGSSDGRSAGSPDNLFADIYVALGKMQRRGDLAFRVRNGKQIFEYPADFSYRERLITILSNILDTCLALEGKPTKVYLRLGLFAAEAVKNIWISDGPDSLEEQFVRMLEEKGTIAAGDVEAEIKRMKAPVQQEIQEIVVKSQALLKDPRFANKHQEALSR